MTFDPKATIDSLLQSSKRRAAQRRSFMLRIGEHNTLLRAGDKIELVSSFQEAGMFRPQRLMLGVVGGEITDLGRFYALRTSRRQARRARVNRRLSHLAALEALRVRDNPRGVTPWIYVTNVQVGAARQIAGDAQIPADLFSPSALDLGMMSDPMNAGMEYRIALWNPDGRDARISAAIAGDYYPDEGSS